MNKLNEIKKLVNNKFNSDKRVKLLGHTAGGIICVLAKNMIRSSGYGVTSTVLMRELKELGKKDAKKIMKTFGIKEKTPENVSKILKIVAYAIGLEFQNKNNQTVITKCPYGECVKELNEPFICNVCLEYNKGIVEAVLGSQYTIDKSKYLLNDGACSFDVHKRI